MSELAALSRAVGERLRARGAGHLCRVLYRRLDRQVVDRYRRQFVLF